MPKQLLIAAGLLLLIHADALCQTRPATRAPRPDPTGWASTQPAGPVAPGAKLEKLADGFSFTEGPTSDVAGNIFFVDQPNDRIMKWSTDGQLSTFMQPSGRANGMSFDAQGQLIACADEMSELWSITPDKQATVLLKDYQGKLLNGPNDVWIRPDGGMYLTDPFYKRDWWQKRGQLQQQNTQGVYFLSADRKTLTRVIDDFQQPNGIIGTPDGRVLYVADIRAGKTFAYTVQSDGTLADKKLFTQFGSDGMTVDSDGNVYTTGRGALQIHDKTGKLIDQIPVNAANCCFGGADGRLLFITAQDAIYGLRMNTHRVGPQ
ncbi:MAG TPA: SMP-30/gluconolactonase/LRE family protein [Tepidisphaeraceae bacterium]|jgi:gluconolactonase